MAFPSKKSRLALVFFFMLLLTWGDCEYGTVVQVIRIVNILGQGTDLEVHCESGDDDLGKKRLSFGESWEFEFVPNIWDSTLFYCRFSWHGESRLYDVYDDSWPDARRPVWEWRISGEGPCTTRYRREPYIFYCYPW